MAEEEAQPSTGGGTLAAGVIDAYMTLADFCDQQLRRKEENLSGEHMITLGVSHYYHKI